MDETASRHPGSGIRPITSRRDRFDARCDPKIHTARIALLEQRVEDVARSVRIRKEFAVSFFVERYSQRSKPGDHLGRRKRFQYSSNDGGVAAVEVPLADRDIGDIAARSSAHQDLRARSGSRVNEGNSQRGVQPSREDCGRKTSGSCADDGDVAGLIYDARPRRPAPRTRLARCARSRSFMRKSESWASPAPVLSGRSPPSFTFKSVMDFCPPVVDLVGCWEAFYANGTGRISNDDFVTRPLGLGSHFTLKRLVAALEEVEHAPECCTGRATKRLSLSPRVFRPKHRGSDLCCRSVDRLLFGCHTRWDFFSRGVLVSRIIGGVPARRGGEHRTVSTRP